MDDYSSRKNVTCSECTHFKPHDTYEYLGYCSKVNEIVIASDEPCGDFCKLNIEAVKNLLEKGGWVYCISTKKVILSVDELEEHLNEVLALEVYSDIVASEESPSAD